jgi:hypothetical protein
LKASPGRTPPRFTEIERLDALWRITDLDQLPLEMFLLRDYRDPLDDTDDNRWLTAVAPVIVKSRGGKSKQTRWVVLVQERTTTALGPVGELRGHLWMQGLLILGILGGLSLSFGLFVMWVLNDCGRSPLHRFLRRRAGLEPLSTGKPTPLLPLTVKVGSKTLS